MDSTIPHGGPSVAHLIARRRDMLASGEAGLAFEGVPLAPIADALGTPCWVLGAGTIRARARRLARAMGQAGLGALGIHYAVKANDHLAVLAVLAAEGFGADVVSGGELRRALRAGVPATRIVFSGVGKTASELALAVETGIGAVHVESVEEIALLSEIASAAGRIQPVMLRINPDIEAGGHDKISTGRATDKFGIARPDAVRAYAAAAALPGLRPVGIAAHIGSQIADPAPFAAASATLADLVREIRAAGYEVRSVDAGGGLAVDYGVGVGEADPVRFADALAAVLRPLDVDVAIEPGRWLVAPAGLLLATVVRRKAATPRPFLVLDAGMNDLARPSLYGAWHGIVPVDPPLFDDPSAHDDPWAKTSEETVDVVGPVCESGDILAPARRLPRLAARSRVAILDAGAYGAVMSSTYNARPRAAVAMVDDGRWTMIRERATAEDLWAGETIPAFGETRA